MSAGAVGTGWRRDRRIRHLRWLPPLLRYLRVGEAMVNRADLLYSCLRDGRSWTHREIFEHVGRFFLVNNAAVELRARGMDVVWSRAGRLHVYQLVGGSLGERERQAQPQGYPRSPEGCCDDSAA